MSDLRRPSAGDESSPGTVEIEHLSPGLAVVRMRGEHDLSTAPQIAHALERAAAHSDVVVDFSDCTFIDSSVIAALVKAALALHVRGEQLVTVIPAESKNVARVAAMVHLSEILPVHTSRDDALASLATAHPGQLDHSA
jgi:anti-sigma B factor antagonist